MFPMNQDLRGTQHKFRALEHSDRIGSIIKTC